MTARRLAFFCLILAGGAVVVALALHSAPVRARVLRYAIAELQSRYHLRLEASRLDYSLMSMRVGLSQVSLAADRTPDRPFFEASYVSAELTRGAFVGDVEFRDVSVVDGRVTIARTAAGTNLPDSGPDDGGAPPALRIGHLAVPRLAVIIRDEPADLVVDIPAVSIDLAADAGRVALMAPARVAIGGRETRVTQAEGGATFNDGRSLRLSSLQVRSDEGSMRVDGTLALIVAEPSFDLRVSGGGELARLSAWGMEGELPQGTLSFDARVAGPITGPTADLQLAAPEITWQRLAGKNLRATARVTTGAVDVTALQFGLADGRVTAKGRLALGNAEESRIAASWSEVDLGGLVRSLVGSTSVLPAGRGSGTLVGRGAIGNPRGWEVDVHLGVGAATNGRARVALPGESRLSLAAGAWRLDGMHRVGNVAPVSFALRGRLADSLTATEMSGEADATGADVAELAGALRLIGVVDVPEQAVTSGTIAAHARLSGRMTAPLVDLRADIGDIGGAWLPVSRIVVDGRLAGNRLTVHSATLTQPSQRGEVSAAGNYDLRRAAYEIEVRVRGWELAPNAEQPLAGRVEAEFVGKGTVAQPEGVGTARLTEGLWNNRALGDVEARVELDGINARIVATAPRFNATADAQTRMAAPYLTVANVRAIDVELPLLTAWIDTPTPLVGTASFTAQGEGAIETWRTGSGRLEVTALNARAGELVLRLDDPARFFYTSGRVRIERLELAAGATRLLASGTLPVTASVGRALSGSPGEPNGDRPTPDADDIILVTLNGDVTESMRALAALGMTQASMVGGQAPLRVLARVTGSIERPVLGGDIEVGPGSVTVPVGSTGSTPLSAENVRGRVHLENDLVELRELRATYQGAELVASGGATLPVGRAFSGSRGGPDTFRPTDLTLKARVTNLSSAALTPLLGGAETEELSGSLDLSLDLRSPTLELARMTGEARIDRMDLRVAELPVTQRSPTRIVARDGFARIDAWNWTGQGATLDVQGQVRLADLQSGIIASGALDLRLLRPFIRSAGLTTAGTLTPRLSITGRLDSPRIDGDVAVNAGEIRLLDPRVVVSGLTGRAVMTRSSVEISTLAGSINGGSLSVSGRAEYRPDARMDASLSADVQGMALEFPAGLRSEVNAALALSVGGPGEGRSGGAPSQAVNETGRLTGSVTVVRGAYRQPLAVVGGLLRALRSDAPVSTADGRAEGAASLDQLALDIRIVTDEDIVVDNTTARLAVGGDLRLLGTVAAPGMSGRAELREGGRIFLGRNVYEVTSGWIDFTNPAAIQPEVSAELTTRAGGQEIDVTLSGTAESPNVALSSPNSELSQADLTSLLVTGRRFDQLGSADAALVGTTVLGNLSGDVLGFAGRAVGLDTLRLGGVESDVRRDPTVIETETETDPTSRMTFGRSIGSNLDVTFSQSLRDSDAQTWIVDYLPSRQLLLRLVSNDEDLRAYEFRHDLTFGAAGAASGQRSRVRGRSPSVAPQVRAVTVVGRLVFPEMRIRGFLRLEPGDRFDFTAWQEDRERLERFYRESGYLTARIAADRMEVGGGITLAYEITAGPETRIAITGTALGESVQSRLRAAWADSILDDFLIDEATAIVKGAMADEGYLQSTVSIRLEDSIGSVAATRAIDRALSSGPAEVVVPSAPVEATVRILAIAVEPGMRTTDVRIATAGVDGALARDIDEWLSMERLARQAARDPSSVSRALTGWLRERGYAGARVTTRAPMFDGATAVVPVTIEPGAMLVLGTVGFHGAMGLGLDVLREAVVDGAVAGTSSARDGGPGLLVPGSPYDQAAIEDARTRLAALYRREGFVLATVAAYSVEASAGGEANRGNGIVNITFEIREGPRQVVAEVVVSGNRGIDADVITRALKLVIDQPLRGDQVVEARRRLFDTGLFRRVDLTSEPIDASAVAPPVRRERIEDRMPDGANVDVVTPMRVRAVVEEWPAVRLRYGVQVAEERPEGSLTGREAVPGLSADVTRRTLFGKAVATGAAVTLQRRDQSGRLFASVPSMLSLPIQSSVTVERAHQLFAASTLVTDKTGITLEQRTRVARNLTVSYAYHFERNHTFDTQPRTTSGLDFDVQVNVARITGSAAWDSRDNPADPTRGSFVSSSLEWAPESAGSEIFFVREVAQAYRYTPWRRLVFASAARLGMVAPLGGQEVIPSVRFFGGGSRTVRGVAEDGLGARDFLGDPAGGQGQLILNQEVRFPLYRWLRGVGFLDAGNVFAKPRDISFGNLVASVGAGLRLATPFAVLRVDYGRAVSGTGTDRSGRWTFGIGHTF